MPKLSNQLNKMKKNFLLIATGLMLAGFVACGPSEEEKNKTEEMMKEEISIDTAALNKAMTDTANQHAEDNASHAH